MLSAENGTYVFSGTDVVLLRGIILAAGLGEYVVSGSDSSLLKSSILSVDSGAFIINGSEATLIYVPLGEYILIASSGSCSMSGIS